MGFNTCLSLPRKLKNRKNIVVSFEDLNRAEYPVLLHAFEADATIEKIVVADSKGPYVIGETELIRL